MKLKSLLLGSAAALVAVSGARAADAVIIPEPEVVEYVRVCDAAGTGFFYIPGTETCLKIGGYARFQIDNSWTEDQDNAQVEFASKLSLQVSSWTDSELGAVETFYEAVAVSGDSLAMDSVYLSFAGLKMGYFGGFLDNGINGETDSSGLNDKFDAIQYTGTAGAVSFGVSLDEISYDVWNDWDGAKFGVEGMLGFSAGAVDVSVIGFYDFYYEAFGVNARVSTDLGAGTLQARGIWVEDKPSNYVSVPGLNWVAEVSYAMPVGDKLTLTPGFSWHELYNNDSIYKVGLTADYALTDTLAVKGSVQYQNSEMGPNDQGAWSNFLRFQASF